MAWRVRSCRGRRTGHRDKGFPRNLGGPAFSTVTRRRGTGSSSPGPRGRTRPRRERIAGATKGYRQAKATKRGGKERRTSEHLVVPVKQGNRSRRDPGEGRGCQVMESLEGNMAGASKPDLVSTRQQRIAELARQSPEMGFTSLAHHI